MPTRRVLALVALGILAALTMTLVGGITNGGTR
jgi:hypothetical protein